MVEETIRYKTRDFIPVAGAFLRAKRIEDKSDKEEPIQDFPVWYGLYHSVSGGLVGTALVCSALEKLF